MHEQPSFDFSARARRSDPESSHAAATRMNRSGKMARQCARVLAIVEATPGLTSAELAERHHEDRQMIARRLANLRDGTKAHPAKLVKNGEQRICNVNKTLALTWLPT